jgi:hypothetical protein
VSFVAFAIDVIDVVCGIEGIAAPAAGAFVVAAEKHDADVDVSFASGGDSGAEAVEVDVVEARKVELWFAVESGAGAGALPGERCGVEFAFAVAMIPGDVARPEADEVVVVRFEEIEVSGEVEGGRRIARAAVD